MTPRQFVDKWAASNLGERQGAQSHFRDLCLLLDRDPPPTDNESYAFEKGAEKTGQGGKGFADVWRRGCFGWEYKGRGADLGAALRQLQAYALDLQNPPYLVVSDMAHIEVHTNWTNTVSKTYAFGLDDLLVPETLNVLRQVFDGSDSLKPGVSPQELTAAIARAFGALGRRLQERKGPDGAPLHHPRAIAHFLNRVVFCMFAEDARLLPDGLFTRMVRSMGKRPATESGRAFDALFAAMRDGGLFGADAVRHFNGGLFDDAPALPLDAADLKLVADLADDHDWSQIDPAIFGTLFEEALKTTRERPALGAHYTDRAKILKIVEPVVIRPLEAEWAQALDAIRGHVAERRAAEAERAAVLEAAADAMRADPAKAKAGEAARRRALAAADKRRDAASAAARARLDAHLDRLAAFRVLDPACGSGNFLYVALHALKDLERRAQVDAEREANIPQAAPRVGLSCVRGIEVEAYAAELARVTLWIGDLQWNAANSYTGLAEPILSTLDQIEQRDALLNEDGAPAEWPAADVIVGNPPFVGGKRLRASLGDAYVERLFKAYGGRVPREADLVVYWVEKAWAAVAPFPLEGGRAGDGGVGTTSIARRRDVSPPDPHAPADTPTQPSPLEGEGSRVRTLRAGLVTTNSVRGGANRRVLDAIADADLLQEAWADEPWALEGAAVRVSMLGFGRGFTERRLEGAPALRINADLTGGGADLTKAARLKENAGVAFIGTQKNGPFDISGTVARKWLAAPLNPNGRPNSDVVRPSWLGSHVARRWDDTWIVYYPTGTTLQQASLYEEPFEYVLTHVAPLRAEQRRAGRRERWWLLGEAMPALQHAIVNLDKFIATPRVAKHRMFVPLPSIAVPDSRLTVIAKEEDVWLGLLSSNPHEIWSLSTASWHGAGNDPTYNAESCFETFPFPEGLTPNLSASAYADDPRAQRIAEAAAELNAKREAWLNPPDLVRIEPEVVPGYPDRILPRDEAAAKVLKTRTLTNLYNARPAWLDGLHRRLDAAVAAAYGWTDWGDAADGAGLPAPEILARLFALNQERAAAGR